jgi:hypothetical protein
MCLLERIRRRLPGGRARRSHASTGLEPATWCLEGETGAERATSGNGPLPEVMGSTAEGSRVRWPCVVPLLPRSVPPAWGCRRRPGVAGSQMIRIDTDSSRAWRASRPGSWQIRQPTEEDLERAAQRPLWSNQVRIEKITLAASLASTERFRWSAHRSSRSSCKAGALPTELRPLVSLRKCDTQVLAQRSLQLMTVQHLICTESARETKARGVSAALFERRCHPMPPSLPPAIRGPRVVSSAR